MSGFYGFVISRVNIQIESSVFVVDVGVGLLCYFPFTIIGLFNQPYEYSFLLGQFITFCIKMIFA